MSATLILRDLIFIGIPSRYCYVHFTDAKAEAWSFSHINALWWHSPINVKANISATTVPAGSVLLEEYWVRKGVGVCCWGYRRKYKSVGSSYHVYVSASGTLLVFLVPEELFVCFCNKIMSLFSLPIIKTFDPVVNSLLLCACNDFMDSFFLLLPPFHKKAINCVEWMGWLDEESVGEWDKDLSSYLLTF